MGSPSTVSRGRCRGDGVAGTVSGGFTPWGARMHHAVQYYAWQKQLFEDGSVAFLRKSNTANERRQKDAQQRRIEELESKIQTKNEVVAELLEEHVKLKNANGES